jgi:hypothetical protein
VWKPVVYFRQCSREVFKESTVIGQRSIVWLQSVILECKLWVPTVAVRVQGVSSRRWRLLEIDSVWIGVQRLFNMWNSDSAIRMTVIWQVVMWAAANKNPIIRSGTHIYWWRYSNTSQYFIFFYLKLLIIPKALGYVVFVITFFVYFSSSSFILHIYYLTGILSHVLNVNKPHSNTDILTRMAPDWTNVN